MTPSLAGALRQISAPSLTGAYHVLPLLNAPGYYAGRNSEGQVALLVRTADASAVPMRLAGLEVRFCVPCELIEPGQVSRIENISVVQCLSTDPDIEAYFAFCAEGLADQLGPIPTADAIMSATSLLIELFQRLKKPAARPVIGLVGELCILLTARSPMAAVQSWRRDTDERFDFVLGRLRMDSKASSQRRRMHSVSFEQANPPAGCLGVLSSIWIEQAAGGTPIAELCRRIEERLGRDPAGIAKVRLTVSEALGETAPAAMEWRFDERLALQSLEFYRADQIPALRPPIASGVTSVRFQSDFAAVRPANVVDLSASLSELESGLLPNER